MISDEDVKRLYLNGQSVLARQGNKPQPYPQFYRGAAPHTWQNQHPNGCERHLRVFDQYNIIPEYCFDCYKVLIQPRTVVELFKLMVIFEKIKLPADNTRKCIVEGRENVSGTYKGFIYCRGIKEGRKILKILDKAVFREISKNIPVTLKRGCSEYAPAYPEYTQIDYGMTRMKYKDEWQEYENLFDEKPFVSPQPKMTGSYNSPSFNLQDANVMLTWLIYAATIGDESYLKISDKTLEPYPNLKRPVPFLPADDE